jgi:hypothetical protein
VWGVVGCWVMWWGASLPGGRRARKIGARTVPVFDRHLVIYGLSATRAAR